MAVMTSGAHAAPAPSRSPIQATSPTADELATWGELLGAVAGELLDSDDEAAEAPRRGTAEGVARALQLQSLRLWMTQLCSARVGIDGTEGAAMLLTLADHAKKAHALLSNLHGSAEYLGRQPPSAVTGLIGLLQHSLGDAVAHCAAITTVISASTSTTTTDGEAA